MSAPTTDLAYLSATEALARFRRRELSPVELMAATIARAEAVEPTVNAFTHTFFDEAMASARQAEARYLGNGKGPEPRALEGLPVAIKDEMPVAGQPNTYACVLFADQIADHTAPLATRVLEAGGIVHARTTQPEFACAGFTFSDLYGVTRNPWNRDYDVGGSSGGAGAALAAGTTTLAGGSDIGGSIRIPASCCGVVGFKPPYGRVPQEPPYNLDHYCHEGPMARTVGDCALFENVVAGPSPHDVASLREAVRLPTDPDALGDVRGWRIALSVDLAGWEVDPDVRRHTLAAADALREAGATVEEVDLGWNRGDITRAARIHYGAIFGAWVAGVIAPQRDLHSPYAVWFADEVTDPALGTVLDGLELEGGIYARLGAVLETYRILLCPTLAIPALPAGEAALADGLGEAALPIGDHLMTIPFNICSRCPVLAVPSGFAAGGVPTGLQIVGRTYDDASVFQAAAALERARPWLDAPARRPAI